MAGRAEKLTGLRNIVQKLVASTLEVKKQDSPFTKLLRNNSKFQGSEWITASTSAERDRINLIAGIILNSLNLEERSAREPSSQKVWSRCLGELNGARELDILDCCSPFFPAFPGAWNLCRKMGGTRVTAKNVAFIATRLYLVVNLISRLTWVSNGICFFSQRLCQRPTKLYCAKSKQQTPDD